MKGICENAHNTLLCCPPPYVDGWCSRCASDRIDKLARRLVALQAIADLNESDLSQEDVYRAEHVFAKIALELILHLERDDV